MLLDVWLRLLPADRCLGQNLVAEQNGSNVSRGPFSGVFTPGPSSNLVPPRNSRVWVTRGFCLGYLGERCRNWKFFIGSIAANLATKQPVAGWLLDDPFAASNRDFFAPELAAETRQRSAALD
jgi:hypothetical protein